MGLFSIEIERGGHRRSNGKTKGQRGVHTEPTAHRRGRLCCSVCTRPVRSRLGSVCNGRRCQDIALHRAGMTDEFGE